MVDDDLSPLNAEMTDTQHVIVDFGGFDAEVHNLRPEASRAWRRALTNNNDLEWNSRHLCRCQARERE